MLNGMSVHVQGNISGRLCVQTVVTIDKWVANAPGIWSNGPMSFGRCRGLRRDSVSSACHSSVLPVICRVPRHQDEGYGHGCLYFHLRFRVLRVLDYAQSRSLAAFMFFQRHAPIRPEISRHGPRPKTRRRHLDSTRTTRLREGAEQKFSLPKSRNANLSNCCSLATSIIDTRYPYIVSYCS